MEELLLAVEESPLSADCRWRLSAALCDAGDLETARYHAKQGVRLEPSSQKCWTVLGATYNCEGRFEMAKACFDRALLIAPGMPTAKWNRSWCNMALGNWEEAWDDYEAGRINKLRPTRIVEREWVGEDLKDKIVLVWGEQGLGDQIQFARYVRFVRELGAKVILEVNKELVTLFEGLADDVTGQPDDFHVPYPYDFHAPLLSLPYKLGKYCGLKEIPSGRLFNCEPGEGIGLCTKGRATHPNDHNRSAKDEDIEHLRKGTVNLNFGEEGNVCGFDLSQTAESISKLERVVTVDTAIAHLAGAMGKPVTMVPPMNNEGRWGTKETTPWYESMNIIRGHESIAQGLETALRG
jgi:hypothetical protein